MVVQQLFSTGKLPKEINVALLTLLPKFENASSIKKFRPITCCSVLYKTISKIFSE